MDVTAPLLEESAVTYARFYEAEIFPDVYDEDLDPMWVEYMDEMYGEDSPDELSPPEVPEIRDTLPNRPEPIDNLENMIRTSSDFFSSMI